MARSGESTRRRERIHCRLQAESLIQTGKELNRGFRPVGRQTAPYPQRLASDRPD